MGASHEQHERYMERAIAHAARGAGQVAPNPMVGCVLVKNANIVGSGWHKGPGLAHAEVEAIANAGAAARGATAYVTLEPCNHHGRTGPCTEALIEAGVAEVIYAMDDPNPMAAGGGERLRAAGIKVSGGVAEERSRHLNRAWLYALTHERPYVIAKTAMSLDGRIATRSGESQWITGEKARARGHLLRAGADAIIVGAGTVIADDPALTARLDSGTKHPLRVVLDSTARTSPGAKVYERAGKGALLGVTRKARTTRLEAFAEMGVDTVVLDADPNGRTDIDALLNALHQRGVVTIMIEGGGEVLGSLFDADLIDEIEIYMAPKLIGGGKPAFGGAGVNRLSEAARFNFEPPEAIGADFLMRGFRNREDG